MATRNKRTGASGSIHVLRRDSDPVKLPKHLKEAKIHRDISPPTVIPPGSKEIEKVSIPRDLTMTAEDRKSLRSLNRTKTILREQSSSGGVAAACGNHEVIATVFKTNGQNLEETDTVGNWAIMPILENGFPNLSGTFFTPMSTIASQPIEVLGGYVNDTAFLGVFDWSCVDGKSGSPSCPSEGGWVYIKSLGSISDKYKVWFWDGCDWKQAIALLNYSRFLHYQGAVIEDEHVVVPAYANEAQCLNWNTHHWHTFYRRTFLRRDTTAYEGPRAFLEFIADSCPDVPRLGFERIRLLSPKSSVWELATDSNSYMRFDLPTRYRYCLLEPNHTWCVIRK